MTIATEYFIFFYEKQYIAIFTKLLNHIVPDLIHHIKKLSQIYVWKSVDIFIILKVVVISIYP